MSDSRAAIYDNLHGIQLERDAPRARHAAKRILEVLSQYLTVSSVLDVGCGLGDWLVAASEHGISDFRGVEGPWLDPRRLHIEPSRVNTLDLEKGFSLDRCFDLVVCIEVAEHLSPDAADRFIDTLVEHAPVVLFSAAIPFQGGHHHVNEQFPRYWIARFAERGFRVLDVIRPHIWDDPGIPIWVRQNVLLFAHDDVITNNSTLLAATGHRVILDVVHPDYWMTCSKFLQESRNELNRLLTYLRKGGLFRSEINAKGEMNISRVADPKTSEKPTAE